MKDHVFQGQTVEDAVREAALTLGLKAEDVRYVVLRTPTAAGRGLKATPAQIAVLIAPAAGTAAPAPADDYDDEGDFDDIDENDREIVEDLLADLQDEGFGELSFTVTEDPATLHVDLQGADAARLAANGGDAAVSLEYLLQRAVDRVSDREVRLTCEGRRGTREDTLRRQAEEIATAVEADGVARTTAPLNSYERRIIHMVVGDRPGLCTFSVGEGDQRRVTVAREGAENSRAERSDT